MASSSFLPKIDPVIAIVREAAAAVMDLRGKVQLTIKPDGSPVTRADMESNRIILKSLHKLTPGVGVVAEENDSEVNAGILRKHDCYWVVDPLDVTTNYVAGGDKFSINVALVEDGVPVLGVLYFPAIGTLYYTGDDGKAYRKINDDAPEIMRIYPVSLPTGRGGAPMAVAQKTDVGTKGLAIHSNAIRGVPTIGQHRACMVIEGGASLCSEQAGFRIWDTACTHAIVRAAGGEILAQDGSAIVYNGISQLPAYFVGHPSVLHALLPHTANSETETKKRSHL